MKYIYDRIKLFFFILIILSLLLGIYMFVDTFSKSKEGYGNGETQNEMYSQSVNGNTEVSGNTIATNTKEVLYNPNVYDVQYHDNIGDMAAQNGIYDLSFSKIKAPDMSGNLISYSVVLGEGLPTYYKPGSFVYGPSTYVPNYEDSVYLSRTTGISTLRQIEPTTKSMGGFCSKYANDTTTLEQKCNASSPETCASLSCCVLLGGQKCVVGDESGPLLKSNYTDPFIKNKEVYYFKGRCYGNCE